MAEHSGDRRHVSGLGDLLMQRIVIAVALSGLLTACGQQSQPVGADGAPAQLDYIDAVPIDKDAPPPVAQPEAAAKKDEPETERKPPDGAEAPETAAPAAPASPEPAAKPDDAAAATRRANETTATPYETTPRPN